MKTILFLRALLAIVLIHVTDMSLAQTNLEKQKIAKSTSLKRINTDTTLVKASGYSADAFDLTLNRLPRNFLGNNPIEIANALSRALLKKTEFESTKSLRLKKKGNLMNIFMAT